MEQSLAEIFEQARKLVTDADRKLVEEQERRQAKEREQKLLELAVQVEAAFDFTSKEKLELDPRLDLEEGKPTVEFVVRSLRAIFILQPKDHEKWTLTLMEEGSPPQIQGEFAGGTKGDPGSRRLAAARIVAAIGDWTQKLQPVPKKAVKPETPRWQDGAERREPTYGTFGKFLGY